MIHSSISPSSFKRAVMCPAFPRLSAGVPESRSDYADEGSCAHVVVDWSIRNNSRTALKPPQSEIGEYARHWKNEMLGHAQVMIDYCWYLFDWYQGKCQMNSEAQVDLSWLYPETWGHVDFDIGMPFGRLHVIDYKYGAGVGVEVEDNPQLMGYAIGKIGPQNPREYSDVEITVVQPRKPHVNGPVRSWVISVPDLFTWAYGTLKPALEATENPNAQPNPGDWCKFCLALKADNPCPGVRALTQSTARTDFATPYTPVDPNSLTPDDIARILDAKAPIEAWLKEVANTAHRQAEKGTVIPGYKLVAGKSNRKWKDPLKVEKDLKTLIGDAVYAERKLKSPAQMEKVLKHHKKPIDSVKAYWEKSEAGTTLVPEKDSRSAIQAPRSPQADFAKPL